MSNSGTPTGANGKKTEEIPVNRNIPEKEFQKIWENFFGGEELGFYAFCFESPESGKVIGGEEEENNKKMMSAINVMSPIKYKFEMNRIIEGLKIALKRDDMDKIKRAKTRAIEKRLEKKKAEEKKTAGRTEKPTDEERSN